MESRSVLDYALFQLTPTRTRCDLVIFAGKKSEKIASGLLEPFISHLKSAKDQISKGGYSITLKPAASSDASSWFTKATLERFVRFVSTPEVLERFVTIEREINQIESSIESNDQINGTGQGVASATDGDLKIQIIPSKSKAQSSDNEAEEKPKVRLQRVLESRKAILKKEQAMAYARALVAGFEMDYLYDLVSFSDAFGAQRLREACMNFMELCNKKNDDEIWMDEVAAMQASYLGASGIMLAGENNEISQNDDTSVGTENGLPTEFNPQQTEKAAQIPAWPQHFPHFMQNSHAPIFQPYPGYMFPGMQSHYPPNMPWPANFHESSKDSRRQKSHKKKEKHMNTKNDESVETDHSSSSSDEQDEQDERIDNKKHNRRSSRKVVIRNINYIASERNEKSNDSDSYSSDENEYANDDFLKKLHKPKSSKNKARDGSKKVTSYKSKNDLDDENEGMFNSEEEKKNGNWDIFQIHGHEEYSYRERNLSSLDNKLNKPKYASDDFLFTERNGNEKPDVKFDRGENFHGVVKMSRKDEEFLIPTRAKGESYLQNARFETESSVVKTRKEEDWIVGTKQEIRANPSGNIDPSIFFRDQASADNNPIGENKKDVIMDDSFMVQSRISDRQSQPKDDIFMVTDIVGANQSSNNVHVETSNNYEPEDLKMMLGHDSGAEQVLPSWSNEMDFGNDILQVETVRSRFNAEKSESVDATKVQNGKASKVGASKESGRKISEKGPKSKVLSGSLVRCKSDMPSRSKISTGGSTITRSKSEKDEEKRKRMEELSIQRQKRIAERSAAKSVTPQTSKRPSKEINKNNSVSTKAKLQAPTGENKKSHKPVIRSSTIDRLAAARTTNKPVSTEKPKVGQNKKPTPKVNSVTKNPSLKTTKGNEERKNKANGTNNSNNSSSNIQEMDCNNTKSEGTQVIKSGIEDFATVEELYTVTSVEKREANALSIKDDPIDKNSIQVLEDYDVDDQVGLTTQITLAHTVGNNLKSVDEKGGERKKLTFSPDISVVEISTPPVKDETNEEIIHSRKKWNNGESSPKAPKGFRRLLLFGRKT